LRATVNSSSQITLTWTQSGTYTHFIVERQTGSRSWAVVNNNVTTTSFVHSGLSSRTKYTYRVRAANGLLLSAYSATVSATTLR
jgi:hypothetical protein